MKVAILSTGGVHGTRVVDEHGRELSDCLVGVRFDHVAGGLPKVELEMRGHRIEASGVDARFYLINVGYIRAVELEDGTRIEAAELGLVSHGRDERTR